MIDTRFRESIAEFCRSTADWRRRKAEEYDRDARLEEFASYIVTLPTEDERLIELHRLTAEGDEFRPGQRVLYELGRFRFFHTETGLEPFLDTLVDLARADRNEHGRFGGRLPEGDDPWE
jgi:hypothetical protein